MKRGRQSPDLGLKSGSGSSAKPYKLSLMNLTPEVDTCGTRTQKIKLGIRCQKLRQLKAGSLILGRKVHGGSYSDRSPSLF
jgi:hypothetical protein